MTSSLEPYCSVENKHKNKKCCHLEKKIPKYTFARTFTRNFVERYLLYSDEAKLPSYLVLSARSYDLLLFLHHQKCWEALAFVINDIDVDAILFILRCTTDPSSVLQFVLSWCRGEKHAQRLIGWCSFVLSENVSRKNIVFEHFAESEMTGKRRNKDVRRSERFLKTKQQR